MLACFPNCSSRGIFSSFSNCLVMKKPCVVYGFCPACWWRFYWTFKCFKRKVGFHIFSLSRAHTFLKSHVGGLVAFIPPSLAFSPPGVLAGVCFFLYCLLLADKQNPEFSFFVFSLVASTGDEMWSEGRYDYERLPRERVPPRSHASVSRACCVCLSAILSSPASSNTRGLPALRKSGPSEPFKG